MMYWLLALCWWKIRSKSESNVRAGCTRARKDRSQSAYVTSLSVQKENFLRILDVLKLANGRHAAQARIKSNSLSSKRFVRAWARGFVSSMVYDFSQLSTLAYGMQSILKYWLEEGPLSKRSKFLLKPLPRLHYHDTFCYNCHITS